MGLRIGFSSPSNRPKMSPRIGFSRSDRPAMSPKFGLSDDRSAGRAGKPEVVQPTLDGNPNSYRWKILREKIVDGMIVVEIRYLDCHNYSGKKILVYHDYKKFQELKSKGVLDPHFLETAYSPMARFEPTDKGWKMALHFIKTYKEV